jgi:tRNA(fMet)-specific endonuclease VapC
VYLLDTDTLSNFLRGHEKLSRRILAVPATNVRISIVTVEEMLRGSLDVVNKERQKPRIGLPEAYRRLQSLIVDLQRFQVLGYDLSADGTYRQLKAEVKRIGTNDCRIGASALAQEYTVVTANTRDFGQIPGLKVEDWTL